MRYSDEYLIVETNKYNTKKNVEKIILHYIILFNLENYLIKQILKD